MGKNEIRVVELFAGVGGFRKGLEDCSTRYKTVWANQWEPNRVSQHAFDCYIAHFGESINHVNNDIANVKSLVPSHSLLVGGFPCQDYSVARTGAKGLEGKKGVLWWEINDIVKENLPEYILLENVDRLLKSPTQQRGRDFGVILRCLYEAGYAVEWRVINAADYGCAQKRRRVFIFAFRNKTPLFKTLACDYTEKGVGSLSSWITSYGFFAPAFPVSDKGVIGKHTETFINELQYMTIADVSDSFKAPLYNAGVMINGDILSDELIPIIEPPKTLREIRIEQEVAPHYFLDGSMEKWKYLKGPKRINRKKPNGEAYVFSEGGLCFPDNLDSPARTMLTSESSVNRSTHVIEDYQTGKLRLLTPIECERLNGFDDDWTNTGMPEKFRYFVMGNALVVPLITRIGERLLDVIDNLYS